MATQLNRQITVKGEFKRAVIVNDTLVNGNSCEYDNDKSTFSHAEGYKSKASGMYSHADGTMAEASEDFSYVWSGVDSSNTTISRKSPNDGKGTFSLYTYGYDPTQNNAWTYGIDKVYINGATLKTIYENYKQQAIDTIRTNENTLSDSLYLSSQTKDSVDFAMSSKVKMTNNGTSVFHGTVTMNGDSYFNKSKDASTNDKTIATCEFVHKVVQSYLRNIFGDDIFKESES